MAFRYKINVLAALKEKGYSSTRLRNEHLLGESYMSQLRRGEMVSWAALETICTLLDCQPGDLLEYVADEIPNAETIAAIKELGGTMPENLPTPEKSIQQLEREQEKKKLKE